MKTQRPEVVKRVISHCCQRIQTLADQLLTVEDPRTLKPELQLIADIVTVCGMVPSVEVSDEKAGNR